MKAETKFNLWLWRLGYILNWRRGLYPRLSWSSSLKLWGMTNIFAWIRANWMWNAQHAHSRMKSGRTKAKWQRKRRNEEMRDDHIGDRGRQGWSAPLHHWVWRIRGVVGCERRAKVLLKESNNEGHPNREESIGLRYPQMKNNANTQRNTQSGERC